MRTGQFKNASPIARDNGDAFVISKEFADRRREPGVTLNGHKASTRRHSAGEPRCPYTSAGPHLAKRATRCRSESREKRPGLRKARAGETEGLREARRSSHDLRNVHYRPVPWTSKEAAARVFIPLAVVLQPRRTIATFTTRVS
ncbi:MAG TPA: hypothetical protein VHE82_12670 [Gemmatimonadaceae bacterium]|nr:hypothetical protein [Gemmatimonadaceae bacterium]